MKKIPWNKDEKLSKIHIERMLAARKITNAKKSMKLKSRKCNLDSTHIPYTNKKTRNPTWFKDKNAVGKFVCGICHARQISTPKYSDEERSRVRSKFMKENNPMKNKLIALKLSITKTGVKIGPVHSQEFKDKQKKRFTEDNPSKNGIPKEQRSKISKTRLHRFKIGKIKPSVQKKGENNPRYGIPRSNDVRKAISVANKGKILSQYTINLIKIARKNQKNIGQSGTIPEFMVGIILEKLGISYLSDVPGIIGRPDFLIHQRHIIFVDGVFSHASPREYYSKGQLKPGYLPDDKIIGKKTARMIWNHDEQVTLTLLSEGYFVLRLWEDEIRYKPELVIDKIQSFLKK
jgi:G:T-mismatch repair DNA endonuclease (very short patch repair protein)